MNHWPFDAPEGRALMSYRFRRRAFITAMSGGVGLKIMLRNLESSAQGMRSPARLLVTHWPVGIVAGSNDALWKPTSGSVGGSPALKPFADAGLGADMTVIRGLSTPVGAGGGHEGGTVSLVTGVAPPGARSGEQESDDAYAGRAVVRADPAQERGGAAEAGARVRELDRGQPHGLRRDLHEVPFVLHDFQNVAAVSGPGSEAIPLQARDQPPGPVHEPVQRHASRHAGHRRIERWRRGRRALGGHGRRHAPPVADAMLKQLVGERSVLDFALGELTQVKRLAPSEARSKLSIHTDAVARRGDLGRERHQHALPEPGATGTGGSGGGPDGRRRRRERKRRPDLWRHVHDPAGGPAVPRGHGRPNGGVGNSFGNVTGGAQDDAPIHAQVGRAHLDVLKAAFICDLIRVGTYQWSPGTNHVGFALYPGTTQPYLHHPTSHQISTADTTASSTLAGLNPTRCSSSTCTPGTSRGTPRTSPPGRTPWTAAGTACSTSRAFRS